MNIKALPTGVALAAIATTAMAATTHHRHAPATSVGVYAEPSQPVAYGELNSYLKASPRARASKDWSTTAATGAGVNAAATAPATPATDATPGAANAVPPPAAVPEAAAPGPNATAPTTGTAVNPPPASATPDKPMQPPPATQPPQ